MAEHSPGAEDRLFIDRGLPDQLHHRDRHLVQVLGEKGAGKTSHLLRWRSGLPGPYVHVGPKLERWTRLPVGPVVYWDEVERSVWFPLAIRRAARGDAMVVIGTHRDMSSLAEAAGASVTTFRLGPLHPEEVRRFAARRIAAVGGAPDLFSFDYGQIATRAGGSLREAGRLLHIEVAKTVRRSAAQS